MNSKQPPKQPILEWIVIDKPCSENCRFHKEKNNEIHSNECPNAKKCSVCGYNISVPIYTLFKNPMCCRKTSKLMI